MEVLTELLGHDFDGAEPLREQWRVAKVTSSCDCGCGSLGFEFGADLRASLPTSEATSPLPIEGDLVDDGGVIVGGLIVLLRDGWLDDVDVHSYLDGAMPFPAPAAVRWRRRA